jgi:translation initiation factor 2B subunit (eIF-2B alpha/beta/delta family)
MLVSSSDLRLPDDVGRLVAGIDRGDVLGASRQLTVLGECLSRLADAHAADPRRLRDDVERLLAHVERTRGASSMAVTNGMALMTDPLLAEPDAAAGGDRLRSAVERFRADLARWLRDVRSHGVQLLADADVLLAFDYSSTVAQVVADLAQSRAGVRVVVPEARSLDGGLKYLPDWRSLGVTIHLIPDSAVAWAVESCDAVVVGAETLSAEGGCYNTIGTAVAAGSAARAGVPVHVLSALLKTDLGPFSAARPIPSLDFLGRLGDRVPSTTAEGPALRGDFPDLDYTAPQEISTVVTEHGPLAPQEVRLAAAKLLAEEQQNG